MAKQTVEWRVKPQVDCSVIPLVAQSGLHSAERSGRMRVGRKASTTAAMLGTQRAGWWASQMVGPSALMTAARWDALTAARLELLRAVQMAER
jgi:hypothetical protein